MRPANPFILVSGIIIISVGAVNAAMKSRPETPVFAGGIGLLVLASILDALGEGGTRLATGLMALALTTVLLVEGPALFAAITAKQSGGGKA